MRLPLAAAALLFTVASARADDPGRCDGYGELKGRPELAMARIVGPVGRVPFVRNADNGNGCPNTTDACRDKAYLVPGNQVIASVARNGFTCVDYVGAKGDDRAGWVASANVESEPAPVTGNPDWTGTWKRVEASIAIRPAAGGRLGLKGDATFGALDPDRVKRGDVNVGSFEAVASPQGSGLAFDVGDKATLPVDEGDENDCKVWMRRLGPYLLVDDDNDCGGFNVTFRGIYLRKP